MVQTPYTVYVYKYTFMLKYNIQIDVHIVSQYIIMVQFEMLNGGKAQQKVKREIFK